MIESVWVTVVGYTREREAITVTDPKAEGARTVILKDALSLNLVQTLEGTPSLYTAVPSPTSPTAVTV